MLELKVMLTKVIKNFKISPVTKLDEIVFIADMILRSRDPIEIKLAMRWWIKINEKFSIII